MSAPSVSTATTDLLAYDAEGVARRIAARSEGEPLLTDSEEPPA